MALPSCHPILQPEYNRFIWSLVIHLGEAVAAGTARKAAKREPTSSPGGMDASAASGSMSNASAAGDCQLAALTSRRGWVAACAGRLGEGDHRSLVCKVLCSASMFQQCQLVRGVEQLPGRRPTTQRCNAKRINTPVVFPVPGATCTL